MRSLRLPLRASRSSRSSSRSVSRSKRPRDSFVDPLDERLPLLEAVRFDEEPRPDDEPSLVEDRLPLDDERTLSRPLLLLLWLEPRALLLDALPRTLLVELPRELCDFDRELEPLELF